MVQIIPHRLIYSNIQLPRKATTKFYRKIMPPAPKLTHFLAIPLITPSSRLQLTQSITKFTDAVTNKSTNENPDGIPARAIRPVGTLHLTLGVMSLLDEQRVAGVMEVLKGLDIKSLLPAAVSGEAYKELNITLKGLTSMHDPSKTSILYSAPVDENGRLQTLCQKVRDVFVGEGFIMEEDRPLLLHATILNTVYVPGVRGMGSGGHGKRKARLTVDARELLEVWDDFVWVKDVRVERVVLCRMGARKVEGSDDEEYIVEGSMVMS